MSTSDPFYASASTDKVAQEMLGMLLTYNSPKGVVGGWIVETEAYMGQKDSAAHALKDGELLLMNHYMVLQVQFTSIRSMGGTFLMLRPNRKIFPKEF